MKVQTILKSSLIACMVCYSAVAIAENISNDPKMREGKRHEKMLKEGKKPMTSIPGSRNLVNTLSEKAKESKAQQQREAYNKTIGSSTSGSSSSTSGKSSSTSGSGSSNSGSSTQKK